MAVGKFRRAPAGYRSGFEGSIGVYLKKLGAPVEYEPFRIEYTVPASLHKYTPDWLLLNNGIIIETKGRFTLEDRKKHLLIKGQHPRLDIRFVFQNPGVKLTKRSKTTYAMWCESHGFKYAAKVVPKEWLAETPSLVHASTSSLKEGCNNAGPGSAVQGTRHRRQQNGSSGAASIAGSSLATTN